MISILSLFRLLCWLLSKERVAAITSLSLFPRDFRNTESNSSVGPSNNEGGVLFLVAPPLFVWPWYYIDFAKICNRLQGIYVLLILYLESSLPPIWLIGGQVCHRHRLLVNNFRAPCHYVYRITTVLPTLRTESITGLAVYAITSMTSFPGNILFLVLRNLNEVPYVI